MKQSAIKIKFASIAAASRFTNSNQISSGEILNEISPTEIVVPLYLQQNVDDCDEIEHQEFVEVEQEPMDDFDALTEIY